MCFKKGSIIRVPIITLLTFRMPFESSSQPKITYPIAIMSLVKTTPTAGRFFHLHVVFEGHRNLEL